MKRKEILDLWLTPSQELGNGHHLFTHELYEVLFIENDNNYEVFEWDKRKLDIIKDFTLHEKQNATKK